MLCLLGRPAVATAEGLRPLELRPKALALLVRVVLGDGDQTRSQLAELLFPEAADPRDSLRWHLSYLRARVPEALVVDRATIAARLPTDVAAFRTGARRIVENPLAPEAAETLALYRGDLCAGLRVTASADFHNWLYVEEDDLRRTFRRAVLAYARAAIADGRALDAMPPLRRLTSVDPYLEDAHVLLIDASEAAEHVQEARHAYDRYQRIVRTELHAEPRRELVARYESDLPEGRGLPIDELVPLEHVTIHVVEWPGEEPAVVAIHGSASHAYGLTALGERLAPRVRFIALDLRGHGFSDKPPGRYTVDEHVEDVLQLIDALGLRRPILLGHSIGGAIATFAAEAARERVSGLILFDAVVGDRRFVDDASFVIEMYGPTLEQRFAAFEEYHSRWGDEPEGSTWRHWLARSDRMELAPLPDGTLRRRGLREALVTEWASVARADALAALARVVVPVLIVHGAAPWDGSPYLDAATVEAQLGAASDVRLFVASGQHHVDLVRRPSSSLISAVKDFVEELR